MAIGRYEISLLLTSDLIQGITKLTRTRGGKRAAATKRMNRLNKILADQVDAQTKLALAVLCDLLKNHRPW